MKDHGLYTTNNMIFGYIWNCPMMGCTPRFWQLHVDSMRFHPLDAALLTNPNGIQGLNRVTTFWKSWQWRMRSSTVYTIWL
jgi:hypothetical protein